MALNEEVSMVESAARAEIYRCYEKYKMWLKACGYYDDNDLALNAIAKLNDDSVEKMFD